MALIKKVVGKLEDQDEQSKLLMEMEKQKQGLDFKLESGMLLQTKRQDLIKLMQSKYIDLTNVDKSKMYEIALSFVATIDKDKTGTIAFEEFYEAFANSEEVFLTDAEIKQIFNEIDVSGDGIISLNEFAKALYLVFAEDGIDVDSDPGAGKRE